LTDKGTRNCGQSRLVEDYLLLLMSANIPKAAPRTPKTPKVPIGPSGITNSIPLGTSAKPDFVSGSLSTMLFRLSRYEVIRISDKQTIDAKNAFFFLLNFIFYLETI
jgi:hypothetical protein